MYMYMYICVCLSIYLSINKYLFICLFVYSFICSYYRYAVIYVFMCLFMYCLFIHLLIYYSFSYYIMIRRLAQVVTHRLRHFSLEWVLNPKVRTPTIVQPMATPKRTSPCSISSKFDLQRSTANIRTLNLRLQHFSAPQIGCMYIHLCTCTCYHVLPDLPALPGCALIYHRLCLGELAEQCWKKNKSLTWTMYVHTPSPCLAEQAIQ